MEKQIDKITKTKQKKKQQIKQTKKTWFVHLHCVAFFFFNFVPFYVFFQGKTKNKIKKQTKQFEQIKHMQQNKSMCFPFFVCFFLNCLLRSSVLKICFFLIFHVLFCFVFFSSLKTMKINHWGEHNHSHGKWMNMAHHRMISK